MTNKKDLEERILRNARAEMGSTAGLDDDEAMNIVIDKVFEEKESVSMDLQELDRLINAVFLKTRRRLGILTPLVEDSSVNEIMVNGPDQIFVEKSGRIERSEYTFNCESELEEVIRNIVSDVHREINEMNPIVDARLPDGSRVNAVYKNVAIGGPVLTIRKFGKEKITTGDMVATGTMTREAETLLRSLVICGYNIFVSGGTSSGKTTMLNALSDAIPKDERVIVIEDSMELSLENIDNIVHMECRSANASGKGMVTMSQLIKSSLRMRPNRIIVGEVRGGEVVDMIQAMNTGHQGSMSTGHGNSVQGMLRRLESMYLMAVPLNIDAIRSQIAEGIDLMVHLERTDDGMRKIVEISELLSYAGGEFTMNKLMELDNNGDLIRIADAKMVNTKKIFLKGGDYADRLRELQFID